MVMDSKDSRDDSMKDLPAMDGKDDPSTNLLHMDGKDSKDESPTNQPHVNGKDDDDHSLKNLTNAEGKDDYLTNRQQPPNQAIPENKARDSDSSPDDNTRFYFLDKSADISELAALHHKSDGKVEYTKWRNWSFAQEMKNKQKDKLIEQMAARLQEIEEKLQKIQKFGDE
jgi:hypothetical protein